MFKSKASGYRVGVDFMPTGVAAVGVSSRSSDWGQVQVSDFLPAVGADEQATALRRWVDDHGLQHAPCVSLIAKHDVQMIQLEKPAVAEEEMQQAIGWKIKDMIGYNIEAAVVDYFRYPDSTKQKTQQINAVVANETVVAGYVDRVRSAGLELAVIDIHDLVGKNLGRMLDFGTRTVALLQFTDTDGLLTIYHDNDLYVARDIKIGLLDIDAAMNEGESLYDRLLLELQRSMDYFESFYGLGLVQRMFVFPQSDAVERLVKYLQNYVAYEFDFVDIKAATDQPMHAHCFSAYCAALRSEAA